MRIAVITGGPVFAEASDLVRECDKVICADSGLDYCMRFGIRPDLVIGDLDSVSPEGLRFIETSQIPVHRFPSHKDMTDTDIALQECDKGSEVLLICSFGGRIDHALTNMGLLIKYKKSGMDITATDGVTDIIPLVGEEKITLGGIGPGVYVSLIPFASEKVTGVTTENLIYPLNDAVIEAESSLYVSNEPVEGAENVSVSIRSGQMLLVISPSL